MHAALIKTHIIMSTKVVLWSVFTLTNVFAVFLFALPRVEWLANLVFTRANNAFEVLYFKTNGFVDIFLMAEIAVGMIYFARTISGDDDYHPTPPKIK